MIQSWERTSPILVYHAFYYTGFFITCVKEAVLIRLNVFVVCSLFSVLQSCFFLPKRTTNVRVTDRKRNGKDVPMSENALCSSVTPFMLICSLLRYLHSITQDTPSFFYSITSRVMLELPWVLLRNFLNEKVMFRMESQWNL